MEDSQLPDGVSSRTVETDRLGTRVLESGPEEGTPVLFLHGNLSSARFWAETLSALPDRLRGVAADLRGYGEAEAKPVDATRGLRDFSDDVHAIVEKERSSGESVHVVGWSNGGGVAMQYLIDHPERVASLTLVNPLSPYGFGGTRDADGTPCWDDYAGSGGGIVDEGFVTRLADGDRSAESEASPRNVMLGTYFAPGTDLDLEPEREEAYLTGMLSAAIGDDNYPGDAVASDNWPGTAPGDRGVNNAVSPKHCDLSPVVDVDPKPPVLWVRGARDQIVSDTSLFDPGFLGQAGEIPGWPGEEVFPPQPMVTQTRTVLEAYESSGGQFREFVVEEAGHSPHIERPEEFREALLAHV